MVIESADRRQGAAPGAPVPLRRGLPRIGRVLAPTDFSEVANQAVAVAYALMPSGGTLHLLHAVEAARLPNPLYAHYKSGRRPTAEERADQGRDLEAALRALVPEDAAVRGIETCFEVVEHERPAQAVLAAAERLRVDLICMGTHGRSGLSACVAGSVASEVAAKSPRALLLLRTAK